MGLVNSLKNYALPIVAAGAIVFSYNTKAEGLPIYPETKQAIIQAQDKEKSTPKYVELKKSLDVKVKDYNDYLDSIKKQFSDYLGSLEILTVEKQEKLLEMYDKAYQKKIIADRFKQENNLETVYDDAAHVSPTFCNKLHALLSQNLNGTDFGTPGLERELRKEGINIPVEGNFTSVEMFLTGLGSLFVAGIGYAIFRRRRNNNPSEGLF